MLALKDFDVVGLFVAPAVPCFLAALAVGVPLRRLFDRLGVGRLVWNRALFDLCVMVCVADLLILSLRFGGR